MNKAVPVFFWLVFPRMFLSFPSHLSLFLFLSPVNNMKLDSAYEARFQSSLIPTFILIGAELCLTLFVFMTYPTLNNCLMTDWQRCTKSTGMTWMVSGN